MFDAPPLIRFLARWSLTGAAAGGVFAAALVLTDAGGIGGLIYRSSGAWTAAFMLTMSFAVTFSQVTLLVAMALRSDFGGKGPADDRLARWKSGQSAERKDESPFP